MSKLEELIKGLFPDGVDYYYLGDIGKFYGGLTGKSKDDFKDGNAKFITYKNVYSNPALDINPVETVKILPNENQRILEYGDIIFTGSSETPDECGFSSVVTRIPTENLYLNSFCFIYRLNDKNILLPDFSKHLFRSENLRYQIGKTASGVTRFNVSKDKMAKVKIPVPPIPVQEEIVRILDSFTELTAELTARKKQYEYYRDKLLHSDTTIVYKRLGTFCDLLSGFPFDSSRFKETGIKLMRGMNIKRGYFDFSDDNNRYWQTAKSVEKYLLNDQDIVISMDGSLVGSSYGMVFKKDLPLLLVQRVTRIRTKQANARYVYHYIASGRFTEYVQKKKTAGAIPHISLKDISNFVVPLPPIEIQNRLVEVLDNFDSICSDLKIGLPAEIEARRKQYEYYRDLLLSFASDSSQSVNVERERESRSRAER